MWFNMLENLVVLTRGKNLNFLSVGYLGLRMPLKGIYVSHNIFLNTKLPFNSQQLLVLLEVAKQETDRSRDPA
jgi:hypothetical protein